MISSILCDQTFFQELMVTSLILKICRLSFFEYTHRSSICVRALVEYANYSCLRVENFTKLLTGSV